MYFVFVRVSFTVSVDSSVPDPPVESGQTKSLGTGKKKWFGKKMIGR